MMSHYNLAAVPVVDIGGRLIGRITFDDVIDVVEAEQTEDLLKFGGASGDELLGGEWTSSVRKRRPWLLVNLITPHRWLRSLFSCSKTPSRQS